MGCSDDNGETNVPCPPAGVPERSDFADICVCRYCEFLPDMGGIGEVLASC